MGTLNICCQLHRHIIGQVFSAKFMSKLNGSVKLQELARPVSKAKNAPKGSKSMIHSFPPLFLDQIGRSHCRNNIPSNEMFP
jgi:hypothetical protein